jgi:hypothetical protein
VDARDKFVPMEQLDDVVVSAEAEPAHLVFNGIKPHQDQNRGFNLRHAQVAQNLKARHIGQIEVKGNDVVVITRSIPSSQDLSYIC